MKTAALIATLLTVPMSASSLPFYLGTFCSKAGQPGIYRSTFDSETGAFTRAESAFTALETSWLMWSKDGSRVYTGGFDTYSPRAGWIASLERQEDGSLRLRKKQANSDDSIVHLSLVENRALLGANYNHGNVLAWPLDAHGDPLPAVSDIAHRMPARPNHKPNDRQNEVHPHGIHVAPGGQFAFVPDLGSDRIVAYGIAPDGALTARPELDVTVPDGHGPRHLTFSPDGKFGYEISELVARVRAYAFDATSGRLTLIQDLPALPDSFKGGHSGAEMAVHPSGRFVYVSNRQEYQSIAVFARDGATGKLTEVQQWRPGLTHPRHFTFDPSGAWILVTSTFANHIVSAKLDLETGKIGPIVGQLSLPEPTCIAFPPTPSGVK